MILERGNNMTALKFRYNNEKGVMHYIEFERKKVGLSVYHKCLRKLPLQGY